MVLRNIILYVLLGFTMLVAKAQEIDGGVLFTTNCAACHTIGGGKLVGPDLSGVSEKHERAWIYRFVRNSQAMIAEGDENALEVYNDNNKIAMPPMPLSDDEIDAILAHIASKEDIKVATKSIVETKTESIKPIEKVQNTHNLSDAPNTSVREGMLIGLWIALAASSVMVVGIWYAIRKNPPRDRSK